MSRRLAKPPERELRKSRSLVSRARTRPGRRRVSWPASTVLPRAQSTPGRPSLAGCVYWTPSGCGRWRTACSTRRRLTNCLQKKLVGAVAVRESVAHMRTMFEISGCRARSFVKTVRKMVRYRSWRPPETAPRAGYRATVVRATGACRTAAPRDPAHPDRPEYPDHGRREPAARPRAHPPLRPGIQ